ncbi:MAG: DedA family protein [Burkholderiales bacterium]|nr:DedA family protein [Burkholderiales bacterium]
MDLSHLVTPEATLAGLALAAFLAATLVPASSEAALAAALALHPELLWPAIGTATAANTAGGMTTYLVGRFLATRRPARGLDAVTRWGAPALLFAWLPVVGDALVLAAGWLKVGWAGALAFQAAGRLARYLALVPALALVN